MPIAIATTWPWHGFQFNLTTDKCLADPAAELDSYSVKIVDGQVVLGIPMASMPKTENQHPAAPPRLGENEFHVADLPSGQSMSLTVNGAEVAVYNVGGTLYATQNDCPHAGAPLADSATWKEVL